MIVADAPLKSAALAWSPPVHVTDLARHAGRRRDRDGAVERRRRDVERAGPRADVEVPASERAQYPASAKLPSPLPGVTDHSPRARRVSPADSACRSRRRPRGIGFFDVDL